MDSSGRKVKNIKLSLDELQNFDKEELIKRFIQVQEHNVQLKNLLTKSKLESEPISTPLKCNEKFDFSKWETVHIFIKFLYLGWDYQGYATVEDTLQTIEHHIIQSLLKCCLIQSRENSEYHRCGRTDKGVSAFSQVISVTVRKGKEGANLDYCGMLNRVLPPDIRVIGWCPVESGVSARFNCTKRHYRYFFPRANLNLSAMKEAAEYLKGTHDFRNLCKMDVGNGVVNYVREIIDVAILPLPDSENNGYGMYELKVLGTGFLWHQIRCIMAVLLMVGQNLEKPSIISDLLDVQRYPKKPQYNLAGELGLCLFDTEFDVNTRWCIDNAQLSIVISQLQGMWTSCATKTELLRSMLRELESKVTSDHPQQQIDLLVGTKRPKKHQPLLQRNTCCSLEERVEHYRKKFKNDSVENQQDNGDKNS